MSQAKLYLFIGFPGAGKTTVAKMIAETTGAVHLWADHERHEMFSEPTHSEQESLQLYDRLNERTEALLANGQSVIFDTNFNFYADRQKLREIAARHGAETVVIWMVTPEAVAKDRAVYASITRNGYEAIMGEEKFNNIVSKLEPPASDEQVIKIDGSKLDKSEVIALLNQ